MNVGRTLAAKRGSSSERIRAVRFAVVAHARHTETNYDDLLSSMFERSDARAMVGDAVKEILQLWEYGNS